MVMVVVDDHGDDFDDFYVRGSGRTKDAMVLMSLIY